MCLSIIHTQDLGLIKIFCPTPMHTLFLILPCVQGYASNVYLARCQPMHTLILILPCVQGYASNVYLARCQPTHTLFLILPCTQGYASNVYFARCQFTQELVVLKVYRLNDQGDLEVRE